MAVGINQYDQPSKVQPKIEDVVLKLTDEDSRPAIAFDDAGEVGIIQIALRTYKNNMEKWRVDAGGDDFKNKINGLLDELDKVKQMFNKKG